MHEDGESDTGELEETEAGSQMSERGRKGDVGDAVVGTRRDEGDVHVDSDRRMAPSGGMMMINGTVARHWSRTQATRTLSAAEAEYRAVVTRCS